jgi:integrase
MLHTSEELRMRSGASAKSLRDALLRLEQFLRIEGAALDQAKSRDDGPDPFAQPSPDHDATGQPAAADPDEDLDDEDKVRTTIDARVITLEEFHETIELLLVAEHGSLTKYERGLARLALTLCLRLGLRPPEVFALRLCDIEDDYVYVLPYEGYAPKSNNGVRRVPLSVFLKPDELERLHEFIARKRNANASPQSLLLTGANGAPPPRPRVEPFIKKVLRHVSEHPGTRLYTARHSFASWTYLALLSVDYPEIRSFFTHLKETSAYLESGPELMTKLFGSHENALGKATFAITKLVGHIGPAITRMHYLHGDDLVRYAVVIREAALAHPIKWMELLDLKRSHTYKLLQDGAQLQTLVRRTRTALGWRVSPELDAGGNGRPRYLPRPVDPSPALVPQQPAAAASAASAASAAPEAAGSGASTPRPAVHAATRLSGPAGNGGDAGGDGWIDPRTLLRILQPVAHEAQDISEAARYYRLDAQRLRALFEAFKQALPAVAQPGKAGTREAEAGRATVQHGLDIMALLTSAERYFASRASRDPVGLASDIAFLLDCYDRRDRDFHVRRSADLTRLVSLFEAMSIPPSYVQVILRSARRDEAPPPLPECAQAGELAGYAASPRKCVGVRSAEKAASYAKWVGLMPFSPTSPGAEGWSSSLAIVAVLAKCQLEVWLGGSRTS